LQTTWESTLYKGEDTYPEIRGTGVYGRGPTFYLGGGWTFFLPGGTFFLPGRGDLYLGADLAIYLLFTWIEGRAYHL
jgi:hypothetical protein